MKVVFLSFLLVSLLLSYVEAMPMVAPAPIPSSGSCNGLCKVRCSKAEMSDRCFKYCCLCCNKCKCVPSGTYGNKSECPCYRDMVSSKGTPKCP